jgi:CubicO group peptidase (beta-lactamase class C family)
MKKFIVTITLVKMIAIFTVSGNGAQIEKLSQKIDSLVTLQLSDSLPGGAIAVISKNGILYKNSFGVMNVEQNQKIDENTLFDQASIAKQFTAFAILLLEQEGKLNLDEDIRKYIADLPAYNYKITIRNLLQHTSGIASTDWLRLMSDISFDEVWHHHDEIKLTKKYSQLNFRPNTQHVYSNGGYSLLANIVENVSGMPFGDFLNQRIFKPLGMKSALVYSNPSLNLANDASGYKLAEDKPVNVSSTTDYSYGSGNLWASQNDMIKWGQNFLSPTVGNAHMINRIINKYNTLENGDSLFYTYGLYIRKYKGVKLVQHQGGVPGFNNYFMLFPDDNLIIIASFNNETINARSIVNGIADILLADKIVEQPAKPRVEVDVNIELAKKFTGTYELPDGMELTFEVQKDTFWLLLPGDHKFPLFAEDDYNFFLKAFNAQCTFVASENGEVNNMVWHQRGSSPKGLRVKERIALNIDEIKLFAGRYIHPDLNIEYPVNFEDGKLYVQTPSTFKKYMGIEKLELSHVSGDRFLTSGFGILEFTRDERGKVNGFYMPELGRLQNVRFLKSEI